jgi:hypothetical protein
MKKQVFTLMAVTGMTGLIAAASSTACTDDKVSPGANNTPEGGTTKPPRDSGPTDTPEDNQCPLPNFEFAEADVDKEIKGAWKGPKQQVGSCTTDELATFGKNLDAADKDSTIDDLAKDLGGTCKTCIFSTTSDSNWQIVVAIAGGKPTEGFINFGACIAALVNDDCGHAYQYNQFCADAACSKCADEDTKGCYQKIWGAKGACEQSLNKVEKQCLSLDDAEVACTNETVGNAAVLCGPKVTPPVDAGEDAAKDAQ